MASPHMIFQTENNSLFLGLIIFYYLTKYMITLKFQNSILQKSNFTKMESISQMNNKLSQLNSIFSESTDNFLYTINLHESKFTPKDLQDFQQLITKIKKQVNDQISNFFNQKIKLRNSKYEKKISQYTQSSQNLQNQLLKFRNDLEKQTIALKQEEKRKQMILQHFSEKFYLNSLKKKHLYALKSNVEANKEKNCANEQADKLYKKNLLKKVFFPWRYLTYKDGYQNTVKCQTQNDIQNIHSQYSSIVDILKSKIKDTQELIKIKKAAKGQFAYSLSKNLMKTISNLSLEVMSLNQMSLKDQEFNTKESQCLMKNIDKVIAEKMKSVQTYKENLLGQKIQKIPSGQRQKKIRFV